jgi:DNA-binding transcriptional ArsR family regulator
MDEKKQKGASEKSRAEKGSAPNPSPEEAEVIAERFKALGDPTRLMIIQYLRCLLAEVQTETKYLPSEPGDEESEGDEEEKLPAPPGSATVNDICRHVTGKEKQTSTFSHHLKELRHVGLIQVQKQGKTRLYSLDASGLATLLPYLQDAPPTRKKRPAPIRRKEKEITG